MPDLAMKDLYAANRPRLGHGGDPTGIETSVAESGRGCTRMLTINVAVLLAVVVALRLRRRTEARSRNDEKLTVVIVLVLGVLLAPTAFGQGLMDVVNQLVSGISESSR